MQEAKVVLPGPKCECECDYCDTGYHCGMRPACENPTWEEIDPKIRKLKSERESEYQI